MAVPGDDDVITVPTRLTRPGTDDAGSALRDLGDPNVVAERVA